MSTETNKLQKALVGATFALTFVVVVLGAYTRLTDAGLGCPDWPGCYGQFLVPDTEEEILRAHQLYPDSPVEGDKAWIEMIHRYLASAVGILAIAIVIVAWRNRLRLSLPIALLGLVLVQGAFGAWTVTLKLWPQVVTAHLLGGFATLALLWVYFLKLGGLNRLTKIPRKLRSHIVLFLALLVLQVALGGWTSSNYAALACPEFPHCHGSLFPEMDFQAGFNVFQDIGPNYLGGEMSSEARVAIQMVHRWGAFVVMVVGLILVYRLRTSSRWVLGGLLVAQFSLGIASVLLALPIALAVLHNSTAALLLLTAVTLLVGLMSADPNKHDRVRRTNT